MTATKALEQGQGILRLAPTWVPRTYCIPGRRLKLHPSDLYSFGAHRGGINMRWFASTTRAENGPETTPDEGLSYVVWGDPDRPRKTLLADMVGELGADLLGDGDVERAPRLAHLLQVLRQQRRAAPSPAPDGAARRPRGAAAQARGLLLPPPDEQLRRRLPVHLLRARGRRRQRRRSATVSKCGTRATTTSPSCRRPTGSNSARAGGSPPAFSTGRAACAPMSRSGPATCPPCSSRSSATCRSPGRWSLRACRPNYATTSTTSCRWSTGSRTPRPTSRERHFLTPRPVRPADEMADAGYVENWIIYRNELLAAKELTVMPGRSVTIRDRGPYGMIMVARSRHDGRLAG